MKKKIIIGWVLIITLVLPVSIAYAGSTKWDVYPGDSIQSTIDLASDGDVIYVHEGSYSEFITINSKDISIIAVGSVTISPSSCGGHGDVIQIYDSVVTIDGFTVNGGNICMGGIYARTDNTSTTVTIINNHVFNYKKNGITANLPGTYATITNNEIYGSGPVGTGYWAQNGIQFGYGATGIAQRNLVEADWYTGDDWTASGILIFESNDVLIQDNIIRNSQSGIVVETWCWYEPSASYNRILVNTIEESLWGISVSAWNWMYSNCDPSANNNKVVNNVLTASDGDTGISLGAYDYDGSYVPEAENNKIINNKISGFDYDISDYGTTTKIHANVVY